MKRTKEFSTNKGITLIALVITIIVMLILVGVTISMAVNGGLFDYAGKAVKETNNAMIEEKILAEGKIKINGKWYDNIGQYLDERKNGVQGGDTTGGTTLASQITAENYGDYIAYNVDLDGDTTNTTDWRIFYKNGNNVYLISSDYLYVDNNLAGLVGTIDPGWGPIWLETPQYQEVTSNVVSKFKAEFGDYSVNENGKCVSTLLNTSYWETYAAGIQGAEAIGGPTLEMLVESYNAKSTVMVNKNYGTLTLSKGENGYTVNNLSSDGTADSLYVDPFLEYFEGYWLASPSDDASNEILTVRGSVIQGDPKNADLSTVYLRPVVCLPEGVTATKDVNGTWINLQCF